MPESINGIGTMYCGKSAAIYWHKPSTLERLQPFADQMLCFVICFLPVIPIRPVHVFDDIGSVHRVVPLRWSWALVFQGYMRPWLILFTFLGLLLFLTSVSIVIMHFVSPMQPSALNAGAFLSLTFPAGLLALWRVEQMSRRSRDIRLVMGRHDLGSSDPATWAKEILEAIPFDPEFFGSSNPLKAGESLLKEKNFPKAIMAARFAVAGGEIVLGEELTTRILAQPEIVAQLPALRREPWRRDELLGQILPFPKHQEKQVDAPRIVCALTGVDLTPETGVIFYNGRAYSNEVMDAVGGAGFATFVRENPIVEVPLRADQALLAMETLCAAAFAAVSAMGIVEHYQRGTPTSELLVSTSLLLLMFGLIGYWVYLSNSGKRIVLGNGQFFLGKKTGVATFVDAITNIRRRRWMFLFKVVAIEHPGEEITWPQQGNEKSDVERCLEAAIKLRSGLTEARTNGSRHSVLC